MPEIPPWLQPAAPADFRARGMQLGLSASGQASENAFRQAEMAERQNRSAMAAQQAAAELASQEKARQFEQQFRMQQAARASQQDALEQARFEQEHQLAATASAKKFEAIQNYQKAVQSGMDPNSAILLYGPAMGQSTAEAAAIRAMSAQRNKPAPSWSIQTGPGGEKAWVSSTGALHPLSIPKPAAAKGGMTETSRWNLVKKTEADIQKLQDSSGGMDLTLDEPPKDYSDRNKTKWKQLKARMDELEKQREFLYQGMMDGVGVPGMGAPKTGAGGTTNAPLNFKMDSLKIIPAGGGTNAPAAAGPESNLSPAMAGAAGGLGAAAGMSGDMTDRLFESAGGL